MCRSLPRPHDIVPCQTPREFEASTSTPVEQSAGVLSSGRSFTVKGGAPILPVFGLDGLGRGAKVL